MSEPQDQWQRPNAGGGPAWGQPLPLPPDVTVRTYTGSVEVAEIAFRRDAASMAAEGWYPISQQYQPGSWSGAAFLVALLLFFIVIGILVFVYMILVKPPGMLVVTYQFRGKAVSPTQPGDSASMAPGPAHNP